MLESTKEKGIENGKMVQKNNYGNMDSYEYYHIPLMWEV